MKTAINQVVTAILGGHRRATKYLDDKHTIKATRRGKPSGREKTVEMVLTIGRPNYAERRFIKLAKRAGEPFPIKKVQVR